MNDRNRRELMRAVERVVRPVQASLCRKRRMRDELMAHLTALLDEEWHLLGGEGEALGRAIRRLGNPAELTYELQQTVPARDVIARFVDGLWINSLHKPVLRRAGRNATMAVLVIFLLNCMAVPPFLPALLGKGPWRLFPALVMIGLFVCSLSALTFVFTILEHGLRQAVFGASTRRFRFAIVIGFVSYLFIPATAFLACLTITGDAIPSVGAAVPAAGCALFAPLVLCLVAKEGAEELRYREEWSTLDLG